MRRAAPALALAVVLAPAAARADTGPQLFAQAGCGGCHTLRAAGSTGTAGPNLDDLRPSAAAVAVQVRSGGGGMPSFAGTLSPAQISALAAWISSAAGGAPVPAPAGGGAAGGAQAAPARATAGRAAVRRLQRALHRLGYFHGPFTGTYGPLTTAAVRAFQQASGLAADGVVGPATRAALARAAAAPAGAAGAAGSAAAGALPPPAAWVRRLQVDLGRLGYFAGPDTGVYGPLTTAAVRRFQAAAGIAVDGRWGPQSQAALVSRLG